MFTIIYTIKAKELSLCQLWPDYILPVFYWASKSFVSSCKHPSVLFYLAVESSTACMHRNHSIWVDYLLFSWEILWLWSVDLRLLSMLLIPFFKTLMRLTGLWWDIVLSAFTMGPVALSGTVRKSSISISSNVLHQ